LLSETGMSTETLEHPTTTPKRLSGNAPVLRRIQSEYHEMPGLKLTEAQARRLWGLDRKTCRAVLTTLIERRFLRRTASGTYVRASS
jgi:hypothetical protein